MRSTANSAATRARERRRARDQFGTIVQRTFGTETTQTARRARPAPYRPALVVVRETVITSASCPTTCTRSRVLVGDEHHAVSGLRRAVMRGDRQAVAGGWDQATPSASAPITWANSARSKFDLLEPVLARDPPRLGARSQRLLASCAHRAQLRGEARQVEVGDLIGDLEEVALVIKLADSRCLEHSSRCSPGVRARSRTLCPWKTSSAQSSGCTRPTGRRRRKCDSDTLAWPSSEW